MTQRDLGHRVGLSQSAISLIERGHWDALAIRTVRRVFAVVDARLEATVTWRAGLLDRLLDEGHAVLVGRMTELLRAAGWSVSVEVTFSAFGERGAIDILAVDPVARVALVIEIKTTLNSIEATVRRLDVKARLASGMVQDREGWRPTAVGRLLVIADTSANRRRVARHASTLTVALPARGASVRQWLRRPEAGISGLLFLANSDPSGTGRRSRSYRG